METYMKNHNERTESLIQSLFNEAKNTLIDSANLDDFIDALECLEKRMAVLKYEINENIKSIENEK